MKCVTPLTPKLYGKLMQMCCGCFKCCRDLNGSYTHIADREVCVCVYIYIYI